MAMKEQFQKIKENWLLVLLLVVLFLLLTLFSQPLTTLTSGGSSSYSIQKMPFAKDSFAAESASLGRSVPGIYPFQGDFAPEEQDRLITRIASMTTEVKPGDFKEAESTLKDIITTTNSFLIQEQVDYHGSSGNSQGWYQIKVELEKYEVVVAQLKELGELQSFNEHADDATGSYKNLNLELETEQARLERYQQMLAEAQTVQEKLEVSDRIFNQERTVKYLQDALKNIGQQVSYTAITVSLYEKPSGYATITLTTFSELIQKLVASFNSVLHLIFWVLPYAAAAIGVWFGVRWIKKKRFSRSKLK